ncbi:Ribokinase-like protein [Tribonema minus]|uniref:pyridoxal kinase n=1 Tax=Tribonema minus TaxID=303371 RepID=A0A836CDA8_9STRA|nr:Ribokinase-like protein [Tribonema minus]
MLSCLSRRVAPIASLAARSSMHTSNTMRNASPLVMHSSPLRSEHAKAFQATLPEREGRVLSVQSHTVHGYVGNKAATLPLQLLGLEVDPLNTVHFSTHAGYKHLRGDATTAQQFDTLVEGLKINGVFNYDYVLSGYARSEGLLMSLASIVTELRATNGSKDKHAVRYFLDPVLGDDDCGFYVPQELVATYRDAMLPLATVITPNTFEAQQLRRSS